MEDLLIKVIIGCCAIIFALLGFIGTVFYQKLGKLTDILDTRLGKITEKLGAIEKDFSSELSHIEHRIIKLEHVAGINMHVWDTGGITFGPSSRAVDAKVP